MIRAEFFTQNNKLCGLAIDGHAQYAQTGEDIVCAGVTSAVQLTANGITEVVKADATVDVEDNLIRIRVTTGSPAAAFRMMEALRLHLEILQQQYPQNIQVTASEV